MGNAAVESGNPLVGKVLDGRFRIIERLGAGGMGTVYKAVQSPLDRMVALKVLNPNYDSKRDPGFQRRFFLEASVTSKLKHPNTITVIDYGKTEDGIYYLAMEFVEGITLAQVLLAEGYLPWQRALNVAQQICRSLREAHRAGIIHRDLKPANVMISSEETDHDVVKVLDFGLVKSFQPDGQGGMITEGAELTQAGVFLGSPQYMAPEQARNVADPRSDIYSLGVVMFQMLTGKPPFYAEQSIDVIVKHMKEAPPSIADVRPDVEVPAEVEALVMRCLEKDPGKRFQSMDELLDGLRVVGTAGGMSGVFGNSRASIPVTPPPMGQFSASGAHRAGMTPTPSGPQKLPGSGAFPKPGSGPGSGPRQGSGAFKQSTGNTAPSVNLEISVETSQPSLGPGASGVMSAARPIPASRKVLPFVIFGVSLAVGLGTVYALSRDTTPIAARTTPPAVTPTATNPPKKLPAHDTPPATPQVVKFKVSTEPAGATVTINGRAVGTTPLSLDLPAGADGTASTAFSFALDGYENADVSASGTGPEVLVQKRLQKKPTSSAPKSRNPQKQKVTGYKDDPY